MRDFPWAIILIFAVVVIVLSIVTFASEQARQELPVEPQTTDVCLEFPDGYELAGVSQVARQLAVEAPVFYCRNIETGQYRKCVPSEVVCK